MKNQKIYIAKKLKHLKMSRNNGVEGKVSDCGNLKERARFAKMSEFRACMKSKRVWAGPCGETK